MNPPHDPRRLLRLAGPVGAYPAEPSDEEVAAAVGIPVELVVRFDMNTLAGGPLPGVTAAVASFDAGRLVEYGDQALRALRGAIGTVAAVDPERVVPGAGADELIRLVTTSVAGPGDRVIVPTPTFAMYEVEARLAGAAVETVARREPGQRQPVGLLVEHARRVGARLVWLCSPNNPTADRYPVEEIRELARDVDAIVVVDAVYQEFAEASEGLPPEALSLVAVQDEAPNLVILRSLAKAYGLAGARVGYLVVAPQLAGHFHAARLPLPIGGVSEAAALGALADPAAARLRHREVVRERVRLAEGLTGMGWRVLPSLTNFVLVQPPATESAQGVADRLLERGMVVRSYEAGLLVDWLRITVRGVSENDRLLRALDELLDRDRQTGVRGR